MKRNALIISLGLRSTAENYGAVLQITAFCRYLTQNYNINPTILDYRGVNLQSFRTNRIMTEMLFGNTAKEKVRKFLFSWLIEHRYHANIDFIETNYNTTKPYDYVSIENTNFEYDYYIAESDVIWDPTFRQAGFDKTFFLDKPCFQGGKKIVYAAGLGNANYDEEQKKEFLLLIGGLDYWCVREFYSKEFLENTFKTISTQSVLDPTLMVDKDYYLSLINKRIISKKYVLVYTPAYNNQKLINDAYVYANSKKCKVVIIKRVPSIKHFFDTKIDVCVEKFLNYLNYCEAFFCDSYHGVCLSIQLKKNFYVYEREDGKKISDLCVRLGLQNRIVHDSLIEEEIEYTAVYKKLYNEREVSKKFLDQCFE